MTYHYDRGKKHEEGEFKHFDHVTFWVGNAMQAARHYCIHAGFEPFAYKGLETGEREVVCHVVKQGKIIFEFQSALNPGNKVFGEHLERHGDAVKDVAFSVDNCEALYQTAKSRHEIAGVKDPWTEKDENGEVKFAVVKSYGDLTHTLVEYINYEGLYLPGYVKPRFVPPLLKTLPPVGLKCIDHLVGNQPDDQMLPVEQWYKETLLFHRFWSIDEDLMHTDYSALRSIVMTNHQETIKMPINEAAPGKRKSQVQEYCEYNDGPGVQHIASITEDIMVTIANMRERGMEFLRIPDAYYEKLKIGLAKSPTKVTQSMETIQKYGILIDYDDKGYLLQIFGRPMQDRPTFFLEIIQRCNHQGFGAGNFKALYEAIEIEQQERGNLV